MEFSGSVGFTHKEIFTSCNFIGLQVNVAINFWT
jgi:hypothetical protein